MMMDREIVVRLVDKSESFETFRQIALIHKIEIPKGFLSTFGIFFLARMYQSLADSPYSFLIVAQKQGKVIGFICGGIDTGKAMKRFLFHQGLFVMPQLISKIFSLKIINKILETFFYPKQKFNHQLPNSEILNFCVLSEMQRKGLGKKLFFELIECFRKKDVKKIKIITGAYQKKAQSFYEGLSAEKVSDIEVHKGIRSYIYIYSIY